MYEVFYEHFIGVRTVIHLPASVTRLEEAFAYLIMYCHVVGIQYPEPLKNVLIFLDYLFETNSPTNKSRSAQKLYGTVYAKDVVDK